MKIMEIVSGAGADRATAHCLGLVRRLARRGHVVTVVCRRGAWIEEQLAAGSGHLGERIDVVESDLHRWPADELRRIARLAHQRRIEVVHTHMSRAHAFGVLLRWRSGLPCVATAQNCHVQLHWMFNDRVIAFSDTARRFHRSYNLVRADRMVTILCGAEGARPIESLTDAATVQQCDAEACSLECHATRLERVFADLIHTRCAA